MRILSLFFRSSKILLILFFVGKKYKYSSKGYLKLFK